MLYAAPGTPGAKLAFRPQYDNFINGSFVPPLKGQYFDVITPIDGKRLHEGRSLDAPKTSNSRSTPPMPPPTAWGRTSAAERADVLLKIADRLEQNLELLAYAETVDNGKPIRETLNADIPLTIDHFRYFAGCVRAQEGALSEIDENTIAYHFHEPLGVVGQIIPWNFPILMAAWKLAPALGAGNCVVLKPAESTPDQHPGAGRADRRLAAAGRAEHRQRLRPRSRHAAGQQQAHRQDRLHRFSTATGRVIAQAAATNLIPATLELGGKSPNIFFADVATATMPSSTRPSKAWCCSPSTRVRCAPARAAR